ncbi:MAG: glycosyltransferase [Dehalococcoidia bacterium]|nr:glycosyltransferase [Dehalococcoidia bacterium]
MAFLIQNQIGIVVFLGIIVSIALSNIFVLRRSRRDKHDGPLPRISVLVPARNEQDNIEGCLISLLTQDYPDFEVLSLDDDSKDETWEKMRALAASHRELRVIKGEPLPQGWIGKHWGCHQLASAASGDLLLFTDADTRHQPSSLRTAAAALTQSRSDLVSVLPKQNAASFAEKLIVPIIYWSMLSFLPLALAYRIRIPSLSFALGQFMLIRYPAYRDVEGHSSIRGHVLDDLQLARNLKSKGMGWRVIDGTDQVECRMYRGLKQAFGGLSKNLFAVFDYNIPVFVWIWILTVFWAPIIVLLLVPSGVFHSNPLLFLSATAVVLSLISWALTTFRFSYSWYLPLLYPLVAWVAVIFAFSSMIMTLRGSTMWKDRRVKHVRRGEGASRTD